MSKWGFLGKVIFDTRAPKDGWAGGTYSCKCLTCGDIFIGDKHAITCADCVYDTKENNVRDN